MIINVILFMSNALSTKITLKLEVKIIGSAEKIKTK